MAGQDGIDQPSRARWNLPLQRDAAETAGPFDPQEFEKGDLRRVQWAFLFSSHARLVAASSIPRSALSEAFRDLACSVPSQTPSGFSWCSRSRRRRPARCRSWCLLWRCPPQEGARKFHVRQSICRLLGSHIDPHHSRHVCVVPATIVPTDSVPRIFVASNSVETDRFELITSRLCKVHPNGRERVIDRVAG